MSRLEKVKNPNSGNINTRTCMEEGERDELLINNEVTLQF